MAGVSFPELVLILVIGLLILGPERLPRVASQIGRWVGRARRTANQLRYQLERELALADIEKASKIKKKHGESGHKDEKEADFAATAGASGPPESGPPESGPPESGPPESGLPESGLPESSPADAGRGAAGNPGAETGDGDAEAHRPAADPAGAGPPGDETERA